MIIYILFLSKYFCSAEDSGTSNSYYVVENYFNNPETFFSHPIEFMECNSVPKIKRRVVKLLSEAKDIYLKEVAFVSHLDSETSRTVPPQSILTDKYLQKEIKYIYFVDKKSLGPFAYTMMLCHLLDNVDWINNYYTKYIDQNNKALVAIMDIIYRFGLCLRKIDEEVNCPDVCKLKEESCRNMGNGTGTCQTTINDQLNQYVVGSVAINEKNTLENIKKEFLKWHIKISRNNRLPLALFSSTLSKDLKMFLQLIAIQYILVLDAQCNCKIYFKYDYFLDSCVDDFDSIFCKNINVCKNGGECERAKDENGMKLNSVKCLCSPAFGGDFCEIERNPCEVLPSTVTCGEFTCLRDINNRKQGFRCRCPQRTYKIDNVDSAKCIDVNECETTKPCKNGAVCQNLVGSYFCECKTGFEGQNCEILPPDPLWSEWSHWTDCRVPSQSEICFQMPYRLQNRECETNVIKQKCIGPRRRLQYECPGLNMGDAYHLCAQAMVDNIEPITESQLGESLEYYYPDDLSDDEEMPEIEIEGPESLPNAADVTYFLLCMIIVVLQIFFVYKWISVLVFVFGAPRKSKEFRGLEIKQPKISEKDKESDVDEVKELPIIEHE